MFGYKCKMIIFSLIFIAGTLFTGCLISSNNESEDSDKDFEMISPFELKTYDAYNPIYLIARYNTKKVNIPAWYYSTDDGEEWEEITFMEEVKRKRDKDPEFEISKGRWKPEDNNLSDTEVIVRAVNYDDQSHDVRVTIKIN